MTREETQARIVGAAFRSLVDGGYHDTTIRDIADQAGMATGLAHYYFDNKDDLLLAALEFGCPIADLDLEGVSAVDQARLGFAAEKHGQIWNQDSYKLVFDMVGVGMHNPKMRAKIGSFLKDRREFITRITEAVMQEAPRRHRASAEAIGAAIWGAFLGIALQRLIDPDFDGDAALDALEEMTESLATVPRQATQEEK